MIDHNYSPNNLQNTNILKKYEQIAYSTPNLEKTDEINIIKDYKLTENPAAKQKIINAYLKTVIFLSKKFSFRNNLTLIDLIQSGIVGICNGLESFNIDQYKTINKNSGGLFAFWVYRNILKQLNDYYRNFVRQISVPDSINTRLLKINKMFKNGELNISNELQKTYIASHLSLTENEVNDLMGLFTPGVELDKLIENNSDSRGGSDVTEYKDLILKSCDEESPDKISIKNETYRIINDKLSELPAEERNMINWRYGFNCKKHSMAELSRKYRVSAATLGKKIVKIENKLKKMLNS